MRSMSRAAKRFPSNRESKVRASAALVVAADHSVLELYYIENAYGHEIFPDPNGEMIKQLQAKETLVYSCGSLWTR